MSGKQPITITEYGSFVSGRTADGYTALPEKTFAQLENFLLTCRGTDALELMTVSAKKGIGKVITAQNYVGTIVMNDGTVIEILPKVCSDHDPDRARRLLVDMLRTLEHSPFKAIQTAHLKADRVPLFEIFIRMFIDEVFVIAKKGLRSGYRTVQANENVVRGKLLFSQQIKQNIAHRERVFVERDEFDVNRPENRLIRATLQFLSRRSGTSRNRADLKTLLNIFACVESSVNYADDFSKCTSERGVRDYAAALRWCRVFLAGQGFTSYTGPEVAWALLYPMEVLFESYVAEKLKRLLPAKDFSVSVQDQRHFLFDSPNRQFQLRPDIVVTRKQDGKVFILDTKWKLLTNTPPRYGISQADMYQMYVYQKKYGAESVTLLYPETDQIPAEQRIAFHSSDGVTVRATFVDPFQLTDSLKTRCDFVRIMTWS